MKMQHKIFVVVKLLNKQNNKNIKTADRNKLKLQIQNSHNKQHWGSCSCHHCHQKTPGISKAQAGKLQIDAGGETYLP